MISVNENNIDRIVRFVAALVLIVWAIFGLATPWNLIAYLVGAILGVTSVIGFCPLYKIIGMSTAKK